MLYLIRLFACAIFCIIVNLSPLAVSAQSGKVFNRTEGYVNSTDNVQLYYRIVGSGRDTIVMLHGGPGFNMEYFAPDEEALAASFVLLFYDQRGNGRSSLISDSLKLGLNDHIDDLEALRNHFKIQRMSVLGHSWGAMLAAQYALKYPDRIDKMVFSSPGPVRREPHLPQIFSYISKWMDSITMKKFNQLRAHRVNPLLDAKETCREYWKLAIRGYFANPNDTVNINRMKGDFCSATSQAIRNGSKVSACTWASLGDWDWRNDFHQLKNDVLIITGDRDFLPSDVVQEWKDALPNSRLLLIKDAGHYPQVEQPEQYFKSVTSFLKTRTKNVPD
jgi:proline iminopeptidase